MLSLGCSSEADDNDDGEIEEIDNTIPQGGQTGSTTGPTLSPTGETLPPESTIGG